MKTRVTLTMRRILPIVLTAAAGSLAVTGTLAYAQMDSDREILSSEDGALLPPEHWECGIYVEEYEDYLEAGNDPAAWHFAGKRYRSAGDGERYDWREWLEWYEDADCAAAGLVDANANPASTAARGAAGGLLGDSKIAMGIVAGLVVTGLIAADGGSDDGGSGNNKSPG